MLLIWSRSSDTVGGDRPPTMCPVVCVIGELLSSEATRVNEQITLEATWQRGEQTSGGESDPDTRRRCDREPQERAPSSRPPPSSSPYGRLYWELCDALMGRDTSTTSFHPSCGEMEKFHSKDVNQMKKKQKKSVFCLNTAGKLLLSLMQMPAWWFLMQPGLYHTGVFRPAYDWFDALSHSLI